VNFADRLDEAVRKKNSPCLVGLDPHLDRLPPQFAAAHDPDASRADVARAAGDFLCEVIELAAEHVPAVKPQSAFFEELGADGVVQWERVVRHAKEHDLLVIGDVKRGDIGSTAAAYARAFFGGHSWSDQASCCDAITVNPYLGTDSIQPFLQACSELGTGLFVLVRTSNPSSAEFQTRKSDNGDTLAESVAQAVVRWGAELIGDSGLSSVGAVVGATHPDELANLRERMPVAPFLIPGYGAQGGSAADIRAGFLAGGRAGLVNSSRGILYAYKQGAAADWKAATQAAIATMTTDIRSALGM
jgi:orotidine-5'-phosphate decarboxylase